MSTTTASVDLTDPYQYESKSSKELKDLIVDLVRHNMELNDDKREYVNSVNVLIKENNTKISKALEVLKNVQTSGN